MAQISATQLVQFLANLLYLVVFLVTFVRAVRSHARTDVDVALLFGATALVIAASWLSSAFRVSPGPLLAAFEGALIMTLPYLLLRLVDDFSMMSAWLLHLSELALLVSVVAIFVVPPPYPLAMTGLLVVYFVALEIYDATAFIRAARRSRGVTRRRMESVALGSLFLGLDILLAGLSAGLPGEAAIWTTGGAIFGLASGVAYLFGFAPPLALRHLWQAPEFRRALRQSATLIRFPDDDALIAELEHACAETVGAPHATIGLWDEAAGLLEFRSNGHRTAYPPERLLAGRVFTTQRALFSPNTTADNPALAGEYERDQTRAALIAPISAGQNRLGVVVVTAPRAPIFAADDLDLLRLLADQIGVVLENRSLVEEMARERARAEALAAAEAERRRANAELEQKVAERTAELRQALQELEAFSYSVSHDLRAPLRTIDGFIHVFLEDYGNRLDDVGRDYLERTRAASQRMGQLIDGLLRLSRVTRSELIHEPVDLSDLARNIVAELRRADPDRSVVVEIEDNLVADGDRQLLRVALENLLANAWKFTAKRPDARIAFGAVRGGGPTTYVIRDNGAGFDMAFADKLFGPFQRLHRLDEFEGTGIGLATVQRIVRRHGGQIRGEGVVGQGATFSFTLAPGIVGTALQGTANGARERGDQGMHERAPDSASGG